MQGAITPEKLSAPRYYLVNESSNDVGCSSQRRNVFLHLNEHLPQGQQGQPSPVKERTWQPTSESPGQVNATEIKCALASSERCVYWCMVLLGFGYLAPYNAMLTAVDFFSDEFGSATEYYLATALVCPNVMVLLISILLEKGFPGSDRQKVVGGFTVLFAASVGLPFINSLVLLLATAFVVGCASAVIQGTLYSLCGLCGPEHTAGISAGNGLAGLVICLIRMATKSCNDLSDKVSVVIFFAVAAGLCAICIIVDAFVVERTEFILALRRRAGNGFVGDGNSTKGGSEIMEKLSTGLVTPTSASCRLQNDSAIDAQDLESGPGMALSTYTTIVRLRGCIASVMLVFLVSLSLFPGLVSEMQSEHFSDGWWSLILITIFNATDFLGRMLPSLTSMRWLRVRGLIFGSCVRLFFVPLFMLSVKPLVITSSIAQAAIVASFGVSNGILGTVAMMVGPEQVPPHMKDQAGLIMVFFLTSGLAIGSWLGISLKEVMDQTNA